jgi:hypothetical protein
MKDSPVFVRTYDLILWLLPAATRFPRVHRFGLGERVVSRALDFQESLLAAGLQSGEERANWLNQADSQLAQLTQLVRLCKDLELISICQYEHAAAMLVEIGRLLGGWIKKQKGQAEQEARPARRVVEQQS